MKQTVDDFSREMTRRALNAAGIEIQEQDDQVTLAFDDLTRVVTHYMIQHRTLHSFQDYIRSMFPAVALSERIREELEHHHKIFPTSREMNDLETEEHERRTLEMLGTYAAQAAPPPDPSKVN